MRAGYPVRRLARSPAALGALDAVEDRAFDLDDPATLVDGLHGVDTAFYLVHAMTAGDGFAERDRVYATRFATAARVAGVRHVIYLGGLHPRDQQLSEHLRSRREVGDILRRRCGALHVRAGIVIGTGSASFEIMHDLVRRLPIMVTPRWLRNRCQVVDIGDVVEALVAAVNVPGSRDVDLAGPDVLTYRDMLLRLAPLMGRRRPLILDVPVLTPGLSAHWLRFVTSVSLPVAHALVQSLRHDAVAEGSDLFTEVGIRPRGFDEAVKRALAARPSVAGVEIERSWDGRRYSMRQRFRLSPGVRVDRRLLERIDVSLRQVTRRAMLGAMCWSGDDLRLGPWSVVRLGGVRDDASDASIARSILGGTLTGAPGGSMVLSGHPHDDPPSVEVQLTGYQPRLLRLLYLRIQEPLHRALVERAVRRAVTSTAPPSGGTP